MNTSQSSAEISRSAEVRSYLDRHPALSRLADLIRDAARIESGPDACLTLQVYRDPEIDDEQLVLFVPKVAVQVTTLVPAGNAEPEGGTQITKAPGAALGGG